MVGPAKPPTQVVVEGQVGAGRPWLGHVDAGLLGKEEAHHGKAPMCFIASNHCYRLQLPGLPPPQTPYVRVHLC